MLDPKALEAAASAQSFRERCKAILQEIDHDAMLRQHSPVETLMAFVISEKGRGHMVDGVKPLVLYFTDDAERDEFIAIWRAEHPGSISRKMP